MRGAVGWKRAACAGLCGAVLSAACGGSGTKAEKQEGRVQSERKEKTPAGPSPLPVTIRGAAIHEIRLDATPAEEVIVQATVDLRFVNEDPRRSNRKMLKRVRWHEDGESGEMRAWALGPCQPHALPDEAYAASRDASRPVVLAEGSHEQHCPFSIELTFPGPRTPARFEWGRMTLEVELEGERPVRSEIELEASRVPVTFSSRALNAVLPRADVYRAVAKAFTTLNMATDTASLDLQIRNPMPGRVRFDAFAFAQRWPFHDGTRPPLDCFDAKLRPGSVEVQAFDSQRLSFAVSNVNEKCVLAFAQIDPEKLFQSMVANIRFEAQLPLLGPTDVWLQNQSMKEW